MSFIITIFIIAVILVILNERRKAKKKTENNVFSVTVEDENPREGYELASGLNINIEFLYPKRDTGLYEKRHLIIHRVKFYAAKSSIYLSGPSLPEKKVKTFVLDKMKDIINIATGEIFDTSGKFFNSQIKPFIKSE